MTGDDDTISRIKAALDAGPVGGEWDVDFASAMRNGSPAVVEYLVRRDGEGISIAAEIVNPETGLPSEATAAHIAACSPDRIARLVAHIEAEQGHIYRLREQIGRDTDTIYTLRGLLTLAREALADCLDDAPTADQLSVSGGVYEGVAAKNAIRAIDAALEGKE